MTRLLPLKFKIKIIVTCVGLAFLVFFSGFIGFNHRIPTQQPATIAKADAIVVLTGGKSRIIDALKLLDAEKGSRLLISGVHKSTSREALAKLVPKQRALLNCCVDLGKAALNTLGNAQETAQWVSKHKFKSLIIVTSNYHMPRSLVVLNHVLPQTNLIAYPVLVSSVPVRQWWTNPGTARLLLREYVKFLATYLRLLVN